MKLRIITIILFAFLCLTGCASNQTVNLTFADKSNLYINTEQKTQPTNSTFNNRISGEWWSEDDKYIKISDNGSFIYKDNYYEPKYICYGIADILNGQDALSFLNLKEEDFEDVKYSIKDVYSINIDLIGATIKNKELSKNELPENLLLIATFIDSSKEMENNIINVYISSTNEYVYFYKM